MPVGWSVGIWARAVKVASLLHSGINWAIVIKVQECSGSDFYSANSQEPFTLPLAGQLHTLCTVYDTQNHRIAESQNRLSWEGSTRIKSNSWPSIGHPNNPTCAWDLVQTLFELFQAWDCDHCPREPVPVPNHPNMQTSWHSHTADMGIPADMGTQCLEHFIPAQPAEGQHAESPAVPLVLNSEPRVLHILQEHTSPFGSRVTIHPGLPQGPEQELWSWMLVMTNVEVSK